jgi:hypothetical protein
MFAEGVGQIGSALGRIRPAGTFSYSTGAGSFNLLVAAFLLYALLDNRWTFPWVRWIAAIALVALLPVSGSRTFVLSLALFLAFALVGGNSSRLLLKITLQIIVAGCAIFGVLMFTHFFQEGMATFSARWTGAIDATTTGTFKESIVLRFFSEFTDAIHELGEAPLVGYGIGLGSNFGAAMTFGHLGFAMAEAEWSRTVMEMGPVVGMLWLSLRSGFGISLIRRAWRSLKDGHALAWLLFATECVAIVNGILEQPTSLGFIVFTSGMCLAAIKSAERGDAGLPVNKKRSRTTSHRQFLLWQARRRRNRSSDPESLAETGAE